MKWSADWCYIRCLISPVYARTRNDLVALKPRHGLAFWSMANNAIMKARSLCYSAVYDYIRSICNERRHFASFFPISFRRKQKENLPYRPTGRQINKQLDRQREKEIHIHTLITYILIATYYTYIDDCWRILYMYIPLPHLEWYSPGRKYTKILGLGFRGFTLILGVVLCIFRFLQRMQLRDGWTIAI